MIRFILYIVVLITAMHLQIAKFLANESDGSDDLEAAKRAEAQRRLRMLGDTVSKAYSKYALRARARDVFVDPTVLEGWWQAYQEGGIDALRPEWVELGRFARELTIERYGMLGIYAEQEYLESDDIRTLAEINKWHFSTTWRWLRRYRDHGLWGLAPEKNPYKWKRQDKEGKRRSALGAIHNDELRETYRRYETIKPLTEKRRVTQSEVQAKAALVGESPRTLRYRLAAYRESGLAGLIPQERSDKRHIHSISPRMERIIRGIRLSIQNATYRTVCDEAQARAKALGEQEPSLWQVRFVVDLIPEPLLFLADRKDREFRSKYRITYRIRF
jgi:transposase